MLNFTEVANKSATLIKQKCFFRKTNIIMPFKTNQAFELSLDQDAIEIKITANGASSSTKRPLAISRDYILSNYNWNGVIKLMQFVYKKHEEVYEIPTQLKGTKEDDQLIVTDEGIGYVLSLQMLDAVKKNRPTATNLDFILSRADGKPGPGFCSTIIKKERLAFLNEMFNKAQKDLVTGQKLVPPSGNASPTTFYEYFKKIVTLRNGLWSDQPGVVNLVGLRRVIVKVRSTDAGYNDTIAACWIDENGIAQCELNIATTEPGNRQSSRQLFPQTMTVVAGYHNLRQPAGRTRNALKEGSNAAINRRVNKLNDLQPSWCPGDTTMNFHQGGNNFLYPSAPGLTDFNAKKARKVWMAKFGLTAKMQKGEPSPKADEETLFKLNLVLSEIYLILSRYGEKGNVAPYKNLSNMVGHLPISRSGIVDGKITVSQQGQTAKVIDVANVKGRTVRIWIDGRRNDATKKKIYEILKHISDYTPTEIKTWKNLSIDQVIALIKDEHIERIIDIQMQYFTKISQGVDGIAGNNFYKMITGIWQKKQDAERDKPRIDELLNELDNLPLNNSIKGVFKKSLTIRTYTNRTNVRDKTKHIDAKDLDIVANVSVGGYSAGCQVFFDTEIFYIFWTKLLKRAHASGQRRWYYTLIDATNFKKSDVIL